MTEKKKKVEKKQLKDYQNETKLKEMYPKMSAGAIARKYGISRGSVLAQLRKFKIKITTRISPKTGPKFFKVDVDRSFHKKEFLKKCLGEGLSIYKIALMCKTNYMQVHHFVLKHSLMPLVKAQRVNAKQKPVETKPVTKAKAKKKK